MISKLSLNISYEIIQIQKNDLILLLLYKKQNDVNKNENNNNMEKLPKLYIVVVV